MVTNFVCVRVWFRLLRGFDLENIDFFFGGGVERITSCGFFGEYRIVKKKWVLYLMCFEVQSLNLDVLCWKG